MAVVIYHSSILYKLFVSDHIHLLALLHDLDPPWAVASARSLVQYSSDYAVHNVAKITGSRQMLYGLANLLGLLVKACADRDDILFGFNVFTPQF